MTAQQYDPTTISMTEPARAHVRRQLKKEGATGLLLGITESGCNGYMYELTYVQDTVDDAQAFDFDKVRVYVEQKNLPLVQGTEIDYVTEGLNSALKFNNPNADTECGCGESFSLRGT